MTPPPTQPARDTADSPASTSTAAPRTQPPATIEPAKALETAGQSGVPAQKSPAQTAPAPNTSGQLPASDQVQPGPTTRTDTPSLATYRPPRPLKQVLPKVNTLPPGVADGVGEVRVAVRVNENGRVIDAHLIEGKKRIGPLLTNVSLAAARQWVFEPASLHGKNIASEHTILFQFRH